MVSYVVQNKNADANRIYVAGHSSGGMMTNVLVGSYPDVFKAGAVFGGVPSTSRHHVRTSLLNRRRRVDWQLVLREEG